MDCLFAGLSLGPFRRSKIFEDEHTFAFADINPQAPTHVLVVPKKHIASLDHASEEDINVLGHLHAVAAEIARSKGLSKGYRTVINTGDDGGQTVDHLHVDLLEPLLANLAPRLEKSRGQYILFLGMFILASSMTRISPSSRTTPVLGVQRSTTW